MADKDSTTITNASTMADADILAGVQSGNSRDFPGSVVKAYVSNAPTLVTPALGTPASGVMTNVTGTASGLTAGNVTTNANLTGDVTSVGNATTIAAGAVDVAMLANGTDGELITWSASAAPATVPVGTATHVLTSNGAGSSPTFQAVAGRSYSGVSATLSADLTAADFTTISAVSWTAEIEDVGGWHSTSSNQSRITVPAGSTTHVDIHCGLLVSSITADEFATISLYKNGSNMLAAGFTDYANTPATFRYLHGSALRVPAVPTDYFEIFINVETDSSVTVNSDRAIFTVRDAS